MQYMGPPIFDKRYCEKRISPMFCVVRMSAKWYSGHHRCYSVKHAIRDFDHGIADLFCQSGCFPGGGR
jgi:hypothetical protein